LLDRSSTSRSEDSTTGISQSFEAGAQLMSYRMMNGLGSHLINFATAR
jgi:hypothetical protein